MTADRHLTDADLLPAIARLPPRQREAATLVWVERLTLRAAGDRMGITHQSVTNLLRKARVNAGHDLVLEPETA